MRLLKIPLDILSTESFIGRHENSKLEKCGNGQYGGQATEDQPSGDAQNDREKEIEKPEVLIRTTHDTFR